VWFRDRTAWRVILLAYLPWLAVLSLAWEAAHARLYTLWYEADAPHIAFSVLHCTLGDVLIGTTALFLALILGREGSPGHWRCWRIALLAASIGASYTVFSEWMNISILRSWSYTQSMPTLQLGKFELGLTPLAHGSSCRRSPFPSRGGATARVHHEPGSSVRRSRWPLARLLPHLRARHAATLLGATPAGLRAFLAMTHRVPVAFLRACVADARAELARVGRELAAARHVRYCETADVRAIDVQADAARHLGDVGFLEARRGAVIAGERTFVAGVDAGFEVLVGHIVLLKGVRPRSARSVRVGGCGGDAGPGSADGCGLGGHSGLRWLESKLNP
jgi:hypothetical protein